MLMSVHTFIRCICEFKYVNWQMQINHTWREGSRAANWLSNFSLTLNSFDLPSSELQNILFDDISDSCMP